MKQNLKPLIAITITILLGALVAWAGSYNGADVGSLPLFAVVVALAFVIQWLVYIHAQLNMTEQYFDLAGSITYISISLIIVLTVPDLSTRSIVLGLMVMLWALRLGSFLYLRIKKDGRDSRFDEIKKVPLRFFNVWNIQGLWVTFTASAAWIAMTSADQVDVDWLFFVGVALWIIGVVIEVTADVQKRMWRSRPENKGRFITTGLWAWSQHPNYFGEITLWLGVALVALPNLSGWQYVGLLSPVFVTILLTKVSGIPLLQKQGEKRWGDEPAYRDYIERTSLLVPLPPRTK
ncbi:DUF1295 domain-containing protein [Changpingibacter yushuensis]|uniref:DUF1295 domain-containing protein n=1 Tax=Changpingibacter yushuensis TaxID=2758440 RepID=UPI00165E29B0|nr:DUF1295 domain-containing protein [Changpingibacter yushuensis]